MNDKRSDEDDLWCDWCGKSTSDGAHRHDSRVFCSPKCIREYRLQASTPNVIELPRRDK